MQTIDDGAKPGAELPEERHQKHIDSQTARHDPPTLDDLTFSYKPSKEQLQYERDGSQDAYNYYRPTEIQPGWQKRLAIALAGMTAVIGPLFYFDYKRNQAALENKPETPAVAPIEPGAGTPVVGSAPDSTVAEEIATESPYQLPEKGNLLHSAEQAAVLIEQQALASDVLEFVEADSYSYVFATVPEVSSSQKGNSRNNRSSAKTSAETNTRALILRGVAAQERASVVQELSEAGASITAQLESPQQTPAVGSGINTGTVLTGVIAFALVANLIWAVSRSRKQNKMMAGQMNPMNSLGKSGGEKVELPDTTLDDVGGLGSQVEELREMVDDIRQVIHGALNIDLPKGVLLMGSPGTGKTLIARAIAGEAGVPFITFDCSQFTALLKGTGPSSVHDGFEMGRKERDALRAELEKVAIEAGESADKDGACILFFDEFDSIGEERGGADGALGDDERKNTVNALLQEFDGVNEAKNRNVIVMAATNFGSKIDKALTRPGRFTKKIRITRPRSPEQRLDILEKLYRKEIEEKGFAIENPEVLQDLAQITPGQTGDDLKAVLRGARDLARRDGDRHLINGDDIFESYQRHSFGRILDTPMSRDYLELVNWHEDGHALSAIGAGIDIFIRSAKPRGDSGGRVVMDPKGFGEILTSKEDMLKRIFIAAGGRAAEIERAGKLSVTGGAKSDFQQMRGLIAQMLSDGMIEDHYALQPIEMRQEHLTERQREICDAIFKSAITYARKGLQAVGNQKMGQIVTDALDLDRELVGQEAMDFYRERLSESDIAHLEGICSQFVNDYLGKSLEDPGGDSASEQDELFPGGFR